MIKFLNRNSRSKRHHDVHNKNDSIIGMEMHIDHHGTEVEVATAVSSITQFSNQHNNDYNNDNNQTTANHRMEMMTMLYPHPAMNQSQKSIFSQGMKFGVSGGRLMKCIASREWGEVLCYMSMAMLSSDKQCNNDHRHYRYKVLVEESSLWNRAPLLSHDAIPQPVLPIHLACVLKPPKDVIDSLLRVYPCGAATPERETGKLPIHLAVLRDASSEVIRTLCQAYPTGLRTSDNDGRCPIHYAAVWRDSAICEILLKIYPASVCAVDSTEHTVFELVTMSRNPHKDKVLDVLKTYDASYKNNQRNRQHKSRPPKEIEGIKTSAERTTTTVKSISKSLQHQLQQKYISQSSNETQSPLHENSQTSRDENVLVAARTIMPSYEYSKISTHATILSQNEVCHNNNENIDDMLSKIVKHRALIISEEMDLTKTAEKIETLACYTEKLQTSKESCLLSIDHCEKHIVEHNNVIEETLLQIRKLEAIIARERKMITMEHSKIYKEQAKINDIGKKDQEIQNELTYLMSKDKDIKTVINNMTVTLTNLETLISRQ